MGDGGVMLHGRILDETGKPIKGAKIHLESRGAKDDRESTDDGSYGVGVIHAPLPPTGKLTVSKDGYETYQREFRSREDLANVKDITLKVASSSKVVSH
jgi:hypothetical protein